MHRPEMDVHVQTLRHCPVPNVDYVQPPLASVAGEYLPLVVDVVDDEEREVLQEVVVQVQVVGQAWEGI